MKISVLLPVYNAGSPLRQAIESILAQDFGGFELLAIDDASTDGSAEIVDEYCRRDHRVRVIYHTSNRGLAGTLNEGLLAARGELVARMDQDDEALPHRLKMQYLFMKTRPEVAVAGSYVFNMGIDRHRDRLVTLPISHSEIAETLKKENCMYHPSVILRRKDILDLGGYRTEFKNAEDYDLWLRVSKKYQMANIPVPLIRYRVSINGMTLSRRWEQLYYVFLAQEAQRDSAEPFTTYEKIAKDRLRAVNRSAYMKSVAKEAAEELMTLGYSEESFELLRLFSSHIGRVRTLLIARNLRRKMQAFKVNSNLEPPV